MSLHAITGAFGYSGQYIARRLLEAGRSVITLTNSPDRPHSLGNRVRAFPFHFDRPDQLAASLRGVSVLYNTYWVRFNHRNFSHADAVRNSLILFRAAREAGVRRVVHVSITNPSLDSPFEYFRAKARLEEALKESGMSWAILRPAVLFGGGQDILINNIAWALRRLPVFGVFGDGRYRLQPIHVADLSHLAVHWGARTDNATVNAIGPETFTYRGLAETLGRIIGHPRPVVGMPPLAGYAAGWLLGRIMKDVMLTWDEMEGLMADLLRVDAPPAGEIRLTGWAREHAAALGRRYASELARRLDRRRGYDRP